MKLHPFTQRGRCCASCNACVLHHPPDDPAFYFCSRNADGTHAPGPGSPWTRWGGGTSGGLSCMSPEFTELRKAWETWSAGREVFAEWVCKYYGVRADRAYKEAKP